MLSAAIIEFRTTPPPGLLPNHGLFRIGDNEPVPQPSNITLAVTGASGSYPTDAMIVLPCSMGTLAAIANGLGANLIQRAADVCLKENRSLILCIRETPFNRIHLRNMQLASDAGAIIFPAIPTLYNHPQTTEDMARQFVHRVLTHIGLPQPGAYQWQPDKPAD